MENEQDPLTLVHLTAAIHQSAQNGSGFAEVFASICSLFECAEVYEPARDLFNGGENLADNLARVAQAASTCAAAGVGSCCHLPTSCKREACAAIAIHLDLAQTTLAAAQPAQAPCTLAVDALDIIDQPLVVCDAARRLKHANRAGLIELESGLWLGLHQGHVVPRNTWDVKRFEKMVAGLSVSNSSERLHFPLSSVAGRTAELWMRRLLRRQDLPSLTLIALTEAPVPGVEGDTSQEADQGALAALALTPRQRELARYLLVGNNLTQAAELMGISRGTANGHLKGLFELSRTRRQSDLVAWLSRSLGI